MAEKSQLANSVFRRYADMRECILVQHIENIVVQVFEHVLVLASRRRIRSIVDLKSEKLNNLCGICLTLNRTKLRVGYLKRLIQDLLHAPRNSIRAINTIDNIVYDVTIPRHSKRAEDQVERHIELLVAISGQLHCDGIIVQESQNALI